MSDEVFFLVVIVVALAFMGVAVWWGLRRRRRLLEEMGLGDLGRRESQRRLRDVARGPVPSDPVERQDAARLVVQMVHNRRQLNRWVVSILVVAALLQGVLLVLDAWLEHDFVWNQAASAVFMTVAAVALTVDARQLQHRLAELQSAPPAADAVEQLNTPAP